MLIFKRTRMNCLVAKILILFAFSLSSTAQKCGQFTVNSGLIVNGDDTVRGEFPFLIALWKLSDQSFFCAGNLISQRHAVTAAHCLVQKFKGKALDKEDFVALLGKFNLNHLHERGVVTAEIKKIKVHEDWKNHTQRYDADIALLFFEREVQLSSYIQIVCLPSKLEANDLKEGTVVGWGFSERTGFAKAEDTPKKIQIGKPPSNEFCFLDERGLLELSSNRTFCAGGENSSPCSGDSGGGFYVKSRSVWTLQGLVSSTLLDSDSHCDVTKYSVYTNVAHYVDWIMGEVNGLVGGEPQNDPCLGFCGENARCDILNNKPNCSCPPGYTGDATVFCEREKQVQKDKSRTECSSDRDCSLQQACINKKCVDPCAGTCGRNARCQVINHSPVCSCATGSTGDPFTSCYPEVMERDPNTMLDPCRPSPCGPNSKCRVVNDVEVCSCLDLYIGSPPNCRLEYSYK